MPAKNKPYEQFGPYILFKRLESDALGELWRAGRIEGTQMGPLVALRRLTGGNREALLTGIATARMVAPHLTGTSFVRNQIIDVINGIPFIAHEYANGRSLRHIVNRARGGTGVTPNPIALDQAIVIAEKIALSLATTAEMKYDGKRLAHGSLIPQFVWISDDGEIRVGGQQLGGGMVASLKNAKVGAELGRYFPPEYHSSGETSKTTDVYSMGAILHLAVTGTEPPDPMSASAFAQTIRAAKTMAGAPIPDDIRAILERSLTIDPRARYESIGDMKQALSALAHGGKYSASTFNLAFYLSNLLKKEMEGEAIDREKETKINLAPYLEAPQPPAAAAAQAPAPAIFTSIERTPTSKLPLAIAVGVVAVAAALGTIFVLGSKKEAHPAAKPALASAAPATEQPKAVSEPVVVASPTAPHAASATTGTAMDEAARKKAFEDAVRQKLQEEMMKLQREYTKQLQQQQSKHAPVQAAASSPAPEAAVPSAAPQRPAATDDRSLSAAQLDAQRREPARQETSTQTPQPAPAVAQAQQAPQPPAAAPAIHEGDVVDVTSLDVVPRPLSPIRAEYPALAARQRIQGTVIVTALISESGEVLDVKVLKKVGFGLDESAMRAMRSTRFSSPMKDGKRVKTWFPQQIEFKL